MQKQPINEDKFGLGQIPPDASNELFLDPSFTKEDFKEALNKVFPFTQILLDDEESSRT